MSASQFLSQEAGGDVGGARERRLDTCGVWRWARRMQCGRGDGRSYAGDVDALQLGNGPACEIAKLSVPKQDAVSVTRIITSLSAVERGFPRQASGPLLCLRNRGRRIFGRCRM